MDLPSIYDPKNVEARWYPLWEQARLFSPKTSGGSPYVIVIPPPNVTGSLHMGHALNNTLQDVLIRWKRMSGLVTLWVPGTDHGGIATQNVVEKILKKEGVHRQDLGRERFLERMWSWRRESGDTILMQLKRLGCSLDWSRTRFTMDEGLSRAVMTAFVELYKAGLIYRGKRMVNWCPRCSTALADIEVEHESRKGHLWHIRYPLEKKSSDPKWIVVATTRPETMLGDTAVAVNPKDKRYKSLIGQNIVLPLMNRSIPIVGDVAVDSSFGTGAVKVTPAHDPVDFEIASRHKLEHITVIGFDGKMTEEAGSYKGLDRFLAREKITEDLAVKGLIEKVDDYPLSVVVCYRCGTILEPLESEQWFLSVGPMAENALKASKEGRVKIVPKSWEKPYALWLRNIKDWCISRQIWWGHRIPVWYCRKNPDTCPPIVQVEPPTQCPTCKGVDLEQDPDVLDTWFSSGLWPFSVSGWPDSTPDLKAFYPTSTLVTGHEILYLWVARMVMMGLYFMKDVPFKHVLIHGIVRDKQGRKMSKSLGNVIDPLEIIDKYGTDALRFSLISSAAPGRDMQLAPDGFLGARNFCNKIWNAYRFAVVALTDPELPVLGVDAQGIRDMHVMGAWFKEHHKSLELSDRWILSRFQSACREATKSLDRFDLDQAARQLYDFFWSEFCDWYLELVKCRLNSQIRSALGLPEPEPSSQRSAQITLLYVWEGCLRLLHPLMPYLTEELWQKLPGRRAEAAPSSFLVQADWPQPDGRLSDSKAEDEMGRLQEAVTALRTIRSEMNVPPQTRIDVYAHSTQGNGALKLFEEHIASLQFLAKVGRFQIHEKDDRPPSSASAIVQGAELYVPLAGLIDFAKERARLGKEAEFLSEDAEKLRKKLSNEDFLTHADAEEIQKTKERFEQAAAKLERVKANLALLGQA